MTLLNVTGHRPVKLTAAAVSGPLYKLVTEDGQALNIDGTALTRQWDYRWQGTREQMRVMLEEVPEGLRKQLRPVQLTFPRPARRA